MFTRRLNKALTKDVIKLIMLWTTKPWPWGYKTFFMLNSAEHEIFLLINVEMPTVVGSSTFMSRKNSILGLS